MLDDQINQDIYVTVANYQVQTGFEDIKYCNRFTVLY